MIEKDKKSRRIDLTNRRFGKLTALEKVDVTSHGVAIWLCLCECGNTIDTRSSSLLSGHTKSCGCLQKDHASKLGVQKGKGNLSKDIIDGANVRSLKRTTAKGRSGVKGVVWNTKANKWVAELGFKKKSYYLGAYETIEEATQAREKAYNEIVVPFLEEIEEDK